MDLFSLIVSGIGVYVAVAVLVFGMAWRIYQWRATPASPVKLGIFPKPKTPVARVARLARDTLLFPQSREIEPWMWLFAFVFHLALLGAFIGHLRLLHEFTPLAGAIGEAGMNQFAALAGGGAGILMTIGVLYWFGRRTFGPYKNLSVPEDYLLLALLLLIITMGNHMRFFGTVHAATYREWIQSLLVFKPAFPAELASSSIKWSLDAHMLFVDALFVYFPFSKLVHTIGAFASNLVRTK